MIREIKSAIEIQTEVDRLMYENREIIKDHVKISVPFPILCEIDENGCNWTMGVFKKNIGHNIAASFAVNIVMRKWNLE
jgi:hypothetical protein